MSRLNTGMASEMNIVQLVKDQQVMIAEVWKLSTYLMIPYVGLDFFEAIQTTPLKMKGMMYEPQS